MTDGLNMLRAIAHCEHATQPSALRAAREASVDQIVAHAATKFGVDASALRSAWIRKLLAVSAARAKNKRPAEQECEEADDE